jgi:hypothetical protein
MHPINIRINAADLADVLGAMREWLDHNHLDLAAFRYGNDGPAHAMIHVELADQGQAELFRTRFSGLAV